MTRPAGPDPVDTAVAAVRQATRELTRAARADDPDAVTGAVDRRGHAVEALREALAAAGRGSGDPATRELLEALAHEAADAETALRGVLDGNRADLAALARGTRASLGYAARGALSSALDRSG